jgi:hypothetical protein
MEDMESLSVLTISNTVNDNEILKDEIYSGISSLSVKKNELDTIIEENK